MRKEHANPSPRRRRVLASLALAALLAGPAQAWAVPTCAPRYPSTATLESMFDLAQTVQDALDLLPDARVVVLARGGQDLHRFGLSHSHLAFAVREDDGVWRVRHLLNRCKSDRSDLYREGLANFVGESAAHGDIRLGVPDAALQRSLRVLLDSDGIVAHRLHEARYSVVAYPFSTDYQNSNQWVLEVLARALRGDDTTQPPIEDRMQAQRWLQAHGYAPSRLHINLGERLGARFFVANVAVDDHPARERISGDYSVVTVESVFDFLHRRGALSQDRRIALNPASSLPKDPP